MSFAAQVVEAYLKRGWMIATAESCTGGLVAAAITDIAGSSAVFDRGFVTYSNAAKTAMLGVEPITLETQGAVGALTHSNANVAVAVTGVAGPSGGTAEKPVGLVHFASAVKGGRIMHVERRFGPHSRAEIREGSVQQALQMLLDGAGLECGHHFLDRHFHETARCQLDERIAEGIVDTDRNIGACVRRRNAPQRFNGPERGIARCGLHRAVGSVCFHPAHKGFGQTQFGIGHGEFRIEALARCRGLARAADSGALHQRQEFAVRTHIGSDGIGDIGWNGHTARGLEDRHQRCAARAARRRAKSSPAWCDERVSGDDETIWKPLA